MWDDDTRKEALAWGLVGIGLALALLIVIGVILD
jgi:hypothetical protein